MFSAVYFRENFHLLMIENIQREEGRFGRSIWNGFRFWGSGSVIRHSTSGRTCSACEESSSFLARSVEGRKRDSPRSHELLATGRQRRWCHAARQLEDELRDGSLVERSKLRRCMARIGAIKWVLADAPLLWHPTTFIFAHFPAFMQHWWISGDNQLAQFRGTVVTDTRKYLDWLCLHTGICELHINRKTIKKEKIVMVYWNEVFYSNLLPCISQESKPCSSHSMESRRFNKKSTMETLKRYLFSATCKNNGRFRTCYVSALIIQQNFKRMCCGYT